MEGAGEFSGISFIRALIPFLEDLPSWTSSLLKAPPPNTLTLGIRFQHINLGGHKYSTYSCLVGWNELSDQLTKVSCYWFQSCKKQKEQFSSISSFLDGMGELIPKDDLSKSQTQSRSDWEIKVFPFPGLLDHTSWESLPSLGNQRNPVLIDSAPHCTLTQPMKPWDYYSVT